MLSSTWLVNIMLMYDIVNDLIQTHNQNNKNIICSKFRILTIILYVLCSGLQLSIALDSLLYIIDGTKFCYAIFPFCQLSIIWLGIYVLFLIYEAVMVWKILFVLGLENIFSLYVLGIACAYFSFNKILFYLK
jgi:hypothetical protein